MSDLPLEPMSAAQRVAARERIRARDDSREELRTLLELAEVYQDRHESLVRRLTTIRVLELSILVSALVAVVLVLLSDRSSSNRELLAIVIPAAAALYIGMFEVLVRMRLQRRVERDARAIREVLDIVREVEQVISSSEAWSPLEKAEFRIRLARFDL